jgi:hypothetical protein
MRLKGDMEENKIITFINNYDFIHSPWRKPSFDHILDICHEPQRKKKKTMYSLL